MNVPFNVIVPTRDRAETLLHCLKTVVAQDYDRLRIIVSDNASTDGTREVVHSFNDKRIEYFNTGCRLSMSKNWEFALGKIEDGWVTYLGDDDGLFPWAIETLDELIREFQVEAVSSRFGLYVWPGHLPHIENGSLMIPLATETRLRFTGRELKRVLNGAASYTTLPWLYHGGAASIELINRARHPAGHFFCSQIPDVYSAIALSCATDRYLRTEKPIALNGASRHSTGTSLMNPQTPTIGTSSPFAKFHSEGNIPFHSKLLISKSLQIMVYESYLQASHLHHGTPTVSLEEQLELAVANAANRFRDEIKQKCDAIAALNNTSYRVRKPSIISRLARLRDRCKLAFWVVTKVPSNASFMNVFDATSAAARISSKLKQNPLQLRLILSFRAGQKLVTQTYRFFRVLAHKCVRLAR